MEVILSGKPKFIPEETITNSSGQSRLLSTTKIPFNASGINSPCVLGVAVDITDHRRAQEALAQSRHFVDSILNSTPNLIYVYDLIHEKNVYYNREVQNFLGYTPQKLQELEGRLFKSILHPDDIPNVMEHHRLLSLDGDMREIEYRMKNAAGQWRWLRSRDVLFTRTSTGEPWQILGSAEDITDRKHLESKVLTMAHYDALTDFPNRTLFFERAGLGLSHAKRNNTACAIIFIDLDRFTTINDTLAIPWGIPCLKTRPTRLPSVSVKSIPLPGWVGQIHRIPQRP